MTGVVEFAHEIFGSQDSSESTQKLSP